MRVRVRRGFGVEASHRLAGDEAAFLGEVRVVRAHVQRGLRRQQPLGGDPAPMHLVLDLVLKAVAHVARHPAACSRVGLGVGLGVGFRGRLRVRL